MVAGSKLITATAMGLERLHSTRFATNPCRVAVLFELRIIHTHARQG